MSDLVTRARKAVEDVTPGPWYRDVDEEYGNVVLCEKDGLHCDVVTGGSGLTYANARFIATAHELIPAMADKIEQLEHHLRLTAAALGVMMEESP